MVAFSHPGEQTELLVPAVGGVDPDLFPGSLVD